MSWSRRSEMFGVLSALLLAVAAMGFGLIGTAAQGAGGPWQFSSCPSFEDFTQYVSDHPSIQYIGTGPCTIAIGHPITIPNDVPVSIDGGPAGLILDGANGAGSSFGVVQNSTFTIDHVTLQNNSMVAIDAPHVGSNVTILNSTIVNNGTGADGANGTNPGDDGSNGVSGGGGIIFGGASLTISNSTINNNGTGGDGGAGANGTNGVSGGNGGNGGNGGDGGAGGAGIFFLGTNATLTINGSTISNNGTGGNGAAGANGGSGSAPTGIGGTGGNGGNGGDGGNGINAASAAGSTISITNSTISNNGNAGNGANAGNASGANIGGSGGNAGNGSAGLLVGAVGSTTTIVSSTVAFNGDTGNGGNGGLYAGSGGNAGNFGAGVANAQAGTVTLTASLLVDNSYQNCSGSIADGGYNRSVDYTYPGFSDDSCGFVSSQSATSSNVADADFTLANNGSLGNYGGPTQTIALTPASTQVLDQIPVSNSTCSAGAQTDQRGASRPQGSGCDIGAFELTTSLVPLNCQFTPATPDYVNPDTSQAWYGDNVTMSCSVIDDAAALYGPFITLQTNVDSGATNAQAPLEATSCSGQNCDAVTISGSGDLCLATDPTDCATFPTFAIDREAPTVNFATNGATYPVGQPITLQCTDPDGGSGIASCSATVTPPNGQPQQTVNGSGSIFTPTQLGTYSYNATASDNVGNQSQQISGSFTVGYQLTPLPGNTATVNRGYWAMIRFAPLDGDGHDIASRSLKVTSVELDGPTGSPNYQKIPFAHPFQFGQFGRTAGYQLMINTRSLTPGEWSLVVQIGSGPTATTQTISFTVR